NPAPSANPAPSESQPLAPPPSCSACPDASLSRKGYVSTRAPYEPELAELPPDMTAQAAVSLLGAGRALGGRDDAPRAHWRKPLSNRCDAKDDIVERVGAWAARLPEGQSLLQRRQASEELALLEGCRQVPKGALRWLRIHHLEHCGVELAAPALEQ